MAAYDYKVNFKLFLFLQPGIFLFFFNTPPELKFEVYIELTKHLLTLLWKIIN